MVAFDGDTEDDKRLWRTYLHWGREQLAPGATGAIVDDPLLRLTADESRAVQAIVFSAFALEFRLKRVLTALGAPPRANDGLTRVLDTFWQKLGALPPVAGRAPIVEPSEWGTISARLAELAKLRNKIVHANYAATLAFVRDPRGDPMTRARDFFNCVVDAIRIVNQGTLYDTGADADVRQHFETVKV